MLHAYVYMLRDRQDKQQRDRAMHNTWTSAGMACAACLGKGLKRSDFLLFSRDCYGSMHMRMHMTVS